MVLSNGNTREQLLEKRIEILQERIRQLKKKLKSAYLVLPMTYPSEDDDDEERRSSVLELVSSPSDNPLLLVEQSNARVYETIV